MGVSVENADALPRVEHLREVPAAVRFLSCEPLLGPLDGLNLNGIHWVIAGGESGLGIDYCPAVPVAASGIRNTRLRLVHGGHPPPAGTGGRRYPAAAGGGNNM